MSVDMNMCDIYLVQANTEAPEDLFHVATLLHGDDTKMVLLIHPDQEGLFFIVPERGNNTVSQITPRKNG